MSPALPGPAPTSTTCPARQRIRISSALRVSSSACASRPARNAAATGPVSIHERNRRRAPMSANFAFTRTRQRSANAASVPSEPSSSVSSRSRISRASTGDVPPVDTAICTGERSMIAGMMKLDSSRSSTTLHGMRAALAAADTRALTARSFVAATASHAPSISDGRKLARDVREVAARQRLRHLAAELRRDDGDLRARIEQQRELARGHFPATHEQHRLALDVEEQREVTHQRGAPDCARAARRT